MRDETLPMKTGLLTVAGGAYGFILLAIGFAAAGFGHGVYIPIRLFSSPIWEIAHAVIPATPENQSLALIVILVGVVSLWGCAGWLLASSTRRTARRALVVLLAVHYAAFPLIFFDGDWGYLPRVWEKLSLILTMGFALYLLGQAALCFLLVRSYLSARQADAPTATHQ
jgi:hypothetical protein